MPLVRIRISHGHHEVPDLYRYQACKPMLLSYRSSGQRKRSHRRRAIGLERVRRLRLTPEIPNQPDSQALYARQGIVPNGQKRRCGRVHSGPEAREGGCDPVILGQNASLKDRAYLLAGTGPLHWLSLIHI